jgi:peptide/nickel transport system substrate-binding protein
MKKTEPGDNETFLKNWIEYVVAWNQELPDMPLYANIYYDFYQPRIQGYECAPTWSMANSLARAWVED